MKEINQLRYPIGKFESPQSIDDVHIPSHIDIIASLPRELREATVSLDDIQLDTHYREGGWTIRQVIHHIADSHMNSYCRFKLAMSEENPVIKPYLEKKWSNFADAKSAPVFYSLNLIDAIHGRWVIFMKSMNSEDFKRTYFHPEQHQSIGLFQALSMYSWHCKHHLAHINAVKKRMNW